jgi:hypothetical protein
MLSKSPQLADHSGASGKDRVDSSIRPLELPFSYNTRFLQLAANAAEESKAPPRARGPQILFLIGILQKRIIWKKAERGARHEDYQTKKAHSPKGHVPILVFNPGRKINKSTGL